MLQLFPLLTILSIFNFSYFNCLRHWPMKEREHSTNSNRVSLLNLNKQMTSTSEQYLHVTRWTTLQWHAEMPSSRVIFAFVSAITAKHMRISKKKKKKSKQRKHNFSEKPLKPSRHSLTVGQLGYLQLSDGALEISLQSSQTRNAPRCPARAQAAKLTLCRRSTYFARIAPG